jgi:hypothetical protein
MMNTIDPHDSRRPGALRAHSTPEPDQSPTPPPVPDDEPDPAHAPVEEPRLPEPPIRAN